VTVTEIWRDRRREPCRKALEGLGEERGAKRQNASTSRCRRLVRHLGAVRIGSREGNYLRSSQLFGMPPQGHQRQLRSHVQAPPSAQVGGGVLVRGSAPAMASARKDGQERRNHRSAHQVAMMSGITPVLRASEASSSLHVASCLSPHQSLSAGEGICFSPVQLGSTVTELSAPKPVVRDAVTGISEIHDFTLQAPPSVQLAGEFCVARRDWSATVGEFLYRA
jgi:hypothetical protein